MTNNEQCPMCSAQGRTRLWKTDVSGIDLYRCQRCGGVFGDRVEVRKTQAEDNWYDEPVVVSDYLRVHEAAKSGYFAQVCRELLAILPRASVKHRVLDVGSGLGTFAEFVQTTGEQSLDVIGIEPSKYAVEYASQRGFVTVQGELKEGVPPYQKDFYDVCLMFNVLEHLVEPTEVLRLCASVVKKDGIVVIRVPNIGFHKLLTVFSQPNLNPMGHPMNFSFLGLRLIMENTGLRVHKVLFELGTNTIERPGLLKAPAKKFLYVQAKRLVMLLASAIYLGSFRTVNVAPTMIVIARKN